MKPGVFAVSLCLVLVATTLTRVQAPLGKTQAARVGASKGLGNAAGMQLVQSFGKLPLSFEANQGQTGAEVKFLSRNSGYSVFLTSTEAVLAFGKARARKAGGGGYAAKAALAPGPTEAMPPTVVRMRLAGANPASRVTGEQELPGKSNYLIGNDPSQWRTGVPTYAKVRYEGVYPGVDLVYYGNRRQLEYDFVVAPGRDPQVIRLDIEGAQKLGVDRQGDLVLQAGETEVRLNKPLIYQTIGGERREVAGGYVLRGERQIGFRLGAYDRSQPLVLDPALVYSTYLGGSGVDIPTAIAVDSSGNVYVTGLTGSVNFPTATPFQSFSLAGGSEVFVSKLSASGAALVYSTYLGGSGFDEGWGIGVDASGTAYVAGDTSSQNFPTVNPLQATNGGGFSGFDLFVSRLNASGSALVYSTYLGGSGDDFGVSPGAETVSLLAVDSSGNAYITGATASDNFPKANAAQANRAGTYDAFVTKLNPTGSALVYSTYLGGTGTDLGMGIAIDAAGNAYVTGGTASANFPTKAPFQAAFSGGSVPDAFVTKLDASGALSFSTYLGGNGDEEGHGIVADSSGVYVTGYTTSTNFPLASPFQSVKGSTTEVFVSKFNPSGSALVYSTYLGGNSTDRGLGLGVDSSGRAFIAGWTASTTGFPIANAVQAQIGGSFDAFVTVLNAAGTAAVYSTYLGGSAFDSATALAVDASGSNVYVTGFTESSNFPTLNAFQSTFGGGTCGTAPLTFPCDDAFIAKIATEGASAPIPSVSAGGVVNNASYTLAGSTVAPGSIAAVFGTNLTDGSSCLPPSCNPSFEGGKLKTTMAGAQVTINGTAAPIFYAIPTQLGIQIPTEVAGASATIQVTVKGQTSSARTISLDTVAPGIFSFTADGKGAGAITHPDATGSPVSSQTPARPGEVVIIYATGLGQVSPAAATGTLPGGAAAAISQATVRIDGVPVTPDYAGLSGCCVGLNQINVRIPDSTRSANDIPVVLTIGGKQSNSVTMAVQK